MVDRTIEPVILGRRVPLRQDRDGRPLVIAMPARVEAMEMAATDLFDCLASYTVQELKAKARNHGGPLFEALAAVRALMGGEGGR